MIRRIATPVALLLLAVTTVSADVVVLEGRRGKIRLFGIKSEINGEPVTLQNLDRFLEQSTGVVEKDGYKQVVAKKTANAKPETFSRDQVLEVRFSTEPDDLLDGFDAISARQLGRALALFKDVRDDINQREVFRIEAAFRIGLIYIQGNKHKTAINVLSNWKHTESVYTPQVHQRLALLYTRYRLYPKAREQYKKIETLPGITARWKHMGRLGSAQVDLAERKWGAAEQTAAGVYNSTQSDKALADAAVYAAAIRGKAILGSDNKERLPEAETFLTKAGNLEGAGPAYTAFLFETLGDVLYAQGKLEDARFPYMRVVCLYPEQTSQVSNCLQNAGQIYVDMSAWPKNQEIEGRSDELFVKGVRLLFECASKYGSTQAGSLARQAYRKHKERYLALTEGAAAAKKDTSAEPG